MDNWLASFYQYIEDNHLKVSYLEGLFLSFIVWCVYLEVNPQIGGVFIRPDHKGKKSFRLEGIVPMLTYPFETHHFWLPKNWDLNWITFSQFGAGTWMVLRNMDSIREYLHNLITH